jgi:hypothetical protein
LTCKTKATCRTIIAIEDINMDDVDELELNEDIIDEGKRGPTPQEYGMAAPGDCQDF